MNPITLLCPAVLLAPAVLSDDNAEELAPVVTIVYDFKDSHPDSILSHVRKEVSDLFAPAGIRLDWRSLQHDNCRAAAPRLVVVRFKGYCGPERQGSETMEYTALGWSHMTMESFFPSATSTATTCADF